MRTLTDGAAALLRQRSGPDGPELRHDDRSVQCGAGLLVREAQFYDNLRPHQALGYRIPAEVLQGDVNAPAEESKTGERSLEHVFVP